MEWCGSRRGQNASQAAILVAIIAGLLVGYILFLPPAERERLLFGNDAGGNGGYGGSNGGGSYTQYGPVLVFRETPGTLYPLKSSTSEHNIPSATIFTQINTQEIKTVDSAIVKSGVFSKKILEIQFDADRRGSRNYLLSFNVDEFADSPMRIMLNGHLLYERPVQEKSPSPVPLPIDYLVDGTNTLTIAVDDSGLAFWKANAYYLHNVLITADVIDLSGSVAAQTFSVQESELDSFESAQLQFVPDCDPKKAARLVVNLNTRLMKTGVNKTEEVPNVVYSGLPDCGVLNKVEVSKEMLHQGENMLAFTSMGQYVVDRIKLVVRLKQNDYPTYYFNLPREMYDALDAGHGQLRLTLTFTDYRNAKTGEVVVNGFVQSFATKDYTYQAVIDPGILTPGPNTIQVSPHADRLDIAELKIELV